MTHIASGTTESPPIASICIRANWKMPGVLNRYIKHEKAGDQYVGRSVSGRVRLGKRFAESIPYFDFSPFPTVTKETMMRTQDSWIKSRLPEQARNNEAVFCLFKSCLASIIYHKEWAKVNLHEKNPIRTSPFLFEDIPFAELVRTAFPWTKTDDTPEFTGIPANVVYLARNAELLKQLEEIKGTIFQESTRVISEVSTKVDDALDTRCVGGEGYAMSKYLIEKMDEVIQHVRNTNLGRLTCLPEGAPRMDEVTTHMEEVDDDNDIEGDLEEGFYELDVHEEGVLIEQARDAMVKKANKKILAGRQKNSMYYGFHHGHINPLMETWRYPKHMSLKSLISLWLVGVPCDQVPPLRFLKPVHVKEFDEKGKQLFNMRRVMKIVEHLGRVKNVWKPRNARNYWNGATVNQLWDKISPIILPHCQTVTKKGNKTPTHKTRERSWRTDADKLHKKRKQLLAIK